MNDELKTKAKTKAFHLYCKINDDEIFYNEKKWLMRWGIFYNGNERKEDGRGNEKEEERMERRICWSLHGFFCLSRTAPDKQKGCPFG